MKLAPARVVALLGALAVAASACTSSAATASPVPPSATPAATATPAPSSSATVEPSVTPADVTPPADLGIAHTRLIFVEGQCWDLDMYGMVDPADPRCDIRLDPVLIFQPMNGALVSGNGLLTAPSLATCMADSGLLPDRLAPNTDIYLCLKTNEDVYGFVVQRPDAPGAPLNRLIVDYWLYK
jgi:hypothetical protein